MFMMLPKETYRAVSRKAQAMNMTVGQLVAKAIDLIIAEGD